MEKYYVHAGWTEDKKKIGLLYYDRRSDIVSFEYSEEWLKQSANVLIDPELLTTTGRQFSSLGFFGFLHDSSPDRWGRQLIDKREMKNARAENRRIKQLNNIDYLLEVQDECRLGGFQFTKKGYVSFLSNYESESVPPIEDLRKLEYASLNMDIYKDDRWFSRLLIYGSSLGGARPKANVRDVDGSLWIAKFPKKDDEFDMGALEFLCLELARKCGLNVPPTKIMKFNTYGSTFLTKRFDRIDNKRLRMLSAMTLLKKTDGEKGDYLDLVEAIRDYSFNPEKDLQELYKRLVFNILVSNTDDHLRNHSFLDEGDGLGLSPLYDVTPNPYGQTAVLTVGGYFRDLDSAIENCEYFAMSNEEGIEVVEQFRTIIEENIDEIAIENGISEKQVKIIKDLIEETEEYGKEENEDPSIY